MIVACPNCDKKFKLGEDKFASGSVKLKCTGCETVFEVRAPQKATTFEIKTQDGNQEAGLSAEDIKQRIAAGTLNANDLVATDGEPLSPISGHPEFQGLDFPDQDSEQQDSGSDDLFGAGASDADDDLFGDGGADDDDLFGDGGSDDSSPAEGGERTVDPFDDTVVQPNAGTPNSDDDLFGDSSADDDLFGDAGGDDSDDLFGDSGSSSDEDLFGDDSASADDDLFADGAGSDDDLFGDADADDDDLFGDPGSDASDSDPQPQAQTAAPSQESGDATSNDLFEDAEDDDLFGDPADEASEASNDGSSIFDEEIVDDSTSGADTFYEDQEGVKYDEDIEQELDDKPFDFEDSTDTQVSLDDGDVDDVVSLPFDLPTIEKSNKGLYIGLAVIALLGGLGGVFYALPGQLHSIPFVGEAVEQGHKALGSGWYTQLQSERLQQQVRSHIGKFSAAEAIQLADFLKKDGEKIKHKPELQQLLQYEYLSAVLGGVIRGEQIERLQSYSGSIGSISQAWVAESAEFDAPQDPDLAKFVQGIHQWKSEQISLAQSTLQELEVDGIVDILRQVALAEILYDLDAVEKTIEILTSLGKQTDTPDYVDARMAEIMWSELEQTEKALEIANRILSEKQPKGPIAARLYRIKALALMKQEDINGALQASSKALNEDDGNPDIVAARAAVLNRSGDSIKALLLLEDYIAEFDNHYGVVLQLAIGQQQLNRTDQAIATYKRAMEIDPLEIGAPILLAQLLTDIDRQQEALEIARNLERSFPNSPKVNRDIGKLYLERENYSAAERALKIAFDANPEDELTLTYLGNLYRLQGKLRLAEKYLADARAINDRNTEVALGLGQVYLDQKKYKQAYKIYVTLLADQPQNADILLALAQIKYHTNDNQKAMEYANEAINNRLNLHKGYYLLSLIHTRLKDYSKAVAAATKALDISEDLEYRLQLARSQEGMSRPGIAIKEYQTILNKYPGTIEALSSTARLYRETGNTSKSLDHYQQLLELTPSDPDVYAAIAQLHLANGDTDRAQRAIKSGLQRAPSSVNLLNIQGQIALEAFDYTTARRALMKAKSLNARNGKTRMLLGFYYKSGKSDLNKAQLEFERALRFGLNEVDQSVVEGELDALKYR